LYGVIDLFDRVACETGFSADSATHAADESPVMSGTVMPEPGRAI